MSSELKASFSRSSQVSDINLFIGKQLRKRRKLLGLTQDDLGKMVGVRFQQIQKYECAANKISAERLFQLADALDVSLDYFRPAAKVSQPSHAAPGLLAQSPK